MINKNNIKEKVYSIKFTSSSEYKKALNGLFKQKDLFMVIKGANRQVKNKINDRRVKYYASDDKFIIDMIIYYK